MQEFGHTKWCIPDLYMRSEVVGTMPSHESISFVNTGTRDAKVTVTLMYENKIEQKVISPLVVPPFKSIHLRMDQLEEWDYEVPRNEPYGAIIESTERIVVEYARLNWIDGHMQSFAILAYGQD
jgi:hypothetical protein